MSVKLLNHRGKPVYAYKQNGQWAVKRWSPQVETLLRSTGKRVPTLADIYDFPGYDKPRDCQRTMVEMGLTHKRWLNLSEMRVGKTPGTIWLIDILMQYYGIQRTLITAPLTTIEPVWKSELYQIIPHIPSYYAMKSVDKLRQALHPKNKLQYSIVVINPAKLHLALEELLDWDPQVCIFDEVTDFKAHDTNQYSAKNALMNSKRGWQRYYIPLSGTLGSEKPTDVWTTIRLINKDTPKFFGRFRDQVRYQPNPRTQPYRWENKEDAEEIVASYLHPSLRYKTEQINDMPKHEGMEVMAPMGKAQEAMYKEMLKEFYVEDKGRVISAVNAAVKLWKLLQIASGVVYSETGDHVICGAPGKLEVLDRLIRETPKKTVIMSGWDCQQQYLIKHLSKRYDVGLINGKVKGSNRTAQVKRFQEGPTDVLVCHPKTTKHGLALHAGSLLVWFGPRPSAEEFIQGSARIRGPGTGATVWCELSCTPLEQEWFNIVKNRELSQKRIVDVYRQQILSL